MFEVTLLDIHDHQIQCLQVPAASKMDAVWRAERWLQEHQLRNLVYDMEVREIPSLMYFGKGGSALHPI